MSDAALMLRELSEPWASGERIKSVLDRTSKLCRLTYWRTYDIWYRKARRIEPHEIDQIAEALAIKKEKAARNELHDLKLRLARLEASLNAGDTHFNSSAIDRTRELADRRGGLDRAMARR
ncbi:hypothetical protein [Bradyrhizobium sp. Leo121]|uniref:hypothetical protein n=1 Tax=Bradyrhizobium sp. Leo121 TaxID=1571195 RepID=UPI00102A1982|nr:hypothetical protein [Bradyrhizobium sp. Leo121]